MRKAALNKPCPICTKPMTELKNIVIDHNHSTGEVRGCICRWCNANGGQAENAAIRAKRELTPVEWLTRWTEWIATAGAGLLYPTHKTEAEKKEAAAAKRKKAAAAKAAAAMKGSK